jgi:hypothetical protein
MTGVETVAKRARVSVEAAALRAQRIGLPDVVLAVSDGNKIIRSGRTPGTRANIPPVGVAFSKSLVDPHEEYSCAAASTGVYHAWKVQSSAELPKRPKKTSKELLTEIFSDLGLEGDRSLWSSVHGIIAVANGSVRKDRTREKVYSAILHNIHNRQDSKPGLRQVMGHAKFQKFALARAYEFDI